MPSIREIFGETYRKDFPLEKVTWKDGLKVENPFLPHLERELDYSRKCGIAYQSGYIKRLLTLEASRKIVNGAFDFRKVGEGAEFGCGMYGILYNYLLPDGVRWKQFDINPKAVERNKLFTRIFFGRTPEIEVGNLYDMPFEDSCLDVVAGLSCWDSIGHFEQAIKEVARCLKPGGHFVHYQDLHVSDKPLIIAEAKKRADKGMDTNVPVEVYEDTFPVKEVPGLYRTDYYFVSLKSLEFGWLRFGDYLTRHMRRLFEDAGFRTVLSGERGAEALVDDAEFNGLTNRHGLKRVMDENSYLSAYGKIIRMRDSSVPPGKIKQRSFMDVLVVQKPGSSK